MAAGMLGAVRTWTLRQIEQAVRDSWGLETCDPNQKALAEWTPANPSRGQCGITALVVQNLLNGHLLHLAGGSGGRGDLVTSVDQRLRPVIAPDRGRGAHRTMRTSTPRHGKPLTATVAGRLGRGPPVPASGLISPRIMGTTRGAQSCPAWRPGP